MKICAFFVMKVKMLAAKMNLSIFYTFLKIYFQFIVYLYYYSNRKSLKTRQHSKSQLHQLRFAPRNYPSLLKLKFDSTRTSLSADSILTTEVNQKILYSNFAGVTVKFDSDSFDLVGQQELILE